MKDQGIAPISRRERNKQRVKEQIYLSAMTLFMQKGYDQTSIDEITEAADVSRGTFFNYFQRKDDLIAAWGGNRRDQLNAGLTQVSQDATADCASRLRRCLDTLAQVTNTEAELTRAMLLAWVQAGRPIHEDPHLGTIFASIIDDGIAAGQVDPAIAAGRAGNVLRDIYLGALYHWAHTPPDAFEGDLGDELYASLHIFLRGILRP